jgi:hypothetical protein
MNDQNRGGTFLPISTLLVVLAALGVTVFTQVPLKGTRPYEPKLIEKSEKVKARLWQDPFLAVMDQLKEVEHQAGLESQVTERLKKEVKLTVIGVMVFGGPDAEAKEARIRQRYAVLSALRRLDFVPEDSEHIEFVKFKSSSSVRMTDILPFEWLEKRTEKNGEKEKQRDLQKESVLLLWLNEEALQSKPLAKLTTRFESLGLEATNNNLRILGPAGSTSLLAMLEELLDSEKSKELGKLHGLKIYSATATADDLILLEQASTKQRSGEILYDADAAARRIKKIFADQGIEFRRTILSDRELASSIIDELGLRQVDLLHDDKPCDRHKDHIVLLAEWDTFYGRSLPETFVDVLRQRHNWGGGEGFLKEVPWVHRFSYLRGIDGKLPGEGGGGKQQNEKNVKGTRDDIGELEQPIGRSQYDYLRRLAESIYRLDQDLRKEREGSIKAIGVLGNDLYDKYLVFQALRPRFPGAIFFTTDLDAFLFHPASIKWTRNLVVASAFGLELPRDIQRDVPPFRDSYQTSVFLATLRALAPKGHPVWGGRDPEGLAKQRVFEIGQRRAVDLSGDGDQQGTPGPDADFDTIRDSVVTALALLLASFLLYLLSSRFRYWVNEVLRKWSFYLIIFVVLGGTGILFYLVHANPREEPFSLVAGISIWPTEIIRILAALLSVSFIRSSIRDLQKNRADLEDEFSLPKAATGSEGQESGDNGPKDGGTWLAWSCFFGKNEREDTFPVASCWTRYADCGSKKYRFIRTWIYCIVYFLFGLTVVAIFGVPTAPVRGEVSWWADKVVLVLSLLGFLFLTFLVVDATRLCGQLINAAAETEPKWEPESLNQFATNANIRDEALGEWMLVRLIAKHTEVVGKLIFYPFTIWFLLFVSRMDYFDNWYTPVSLMIFISFTAVCAWSCAFVLRRSSEHARTNVIDRLSKQLLRAMTNKPSCSDDDCISEIKFVVDEVRAMRSGAFAPFTQHPLVQALVLPFGGAGGLALLDLFVKLNL